MKSCSDEANICILAVCIGEIRKEYFKRLHECYPFINVVLCGTQEYLEELKQHQICFDLVVAAPSEDSPEIRSLTVEAVKYAQAENIPSLAISVKDAPEFENILYDCGITECVPYFISDDRLTDRIRQRIDTSVSCKQMHAAYIQREQKLKLHQKKLRALQHILGAVIFDYDIKEDCMKISVGLPEGGLSVKKTEHFLLHSGHLDMLTSESAGKMREIFGILKKEGGTGSIDIMGSPMGLEFGWYRCAYTGLKDESGDVICILGCMRSIENDMKLNEELRAKAERDSMTGLLNHNALLEGIQMHLKHHEGGTVMMIDVDDFKYINDRNSHLYGDKILKHLAKELWNSFRRTDLIGRFGGDEFLVYLPGTFDENFASRKAREINALCNKLEVDNIDIFSLSIGIAIADESEEITAEELIERADKALYEVKRSGKNSVKCYKPE